MSTKSDDANEIETAGTSSATSDSVDPLPQSFETPEYKHDSVDTEEKQGKHNTMKREGKQVKHGHVDRMIESQSEHKQLNMDGDQQNGEDDHTEKRTSDRENNMISMTQSNNDQRTPEEAENADLVRRCVTCETSAEAADNLRKQCEYKNHQIETLEGDLASTRDENENLKRHLEETEKIAADHQRLIDENKSLSESLEQEKQASAVLKEEVQALKEHITNHKNDVNDLERQIKKAIEDKENLEAKLVSRNAGLQKMQQNYQDEARRLEELSVQFRLKQVELTTAENKHKQEIEEMEAKYKTEKDQAEKHKELQQNQIIKLAGESQHLQAENKRLKDDLQTKSMECGDVKSERLRITKDLDATKKEMSELNNVNDKLRADITAVNAEIMQLKAALEFKEAEKKFSNESLEQEKQASAVLKEEVQALKERITNHENAVNDLERQIKKAIEDKENLEAKLVSRNAGLQKMQQNYQDEARRLEELSVQFRLKQVELTTAENKYKQEIEEIKAKYKTEKDQAEKHKELLQNQIIKLAGESQHLQAENKRLKADLQTKSMECGDVKSERLRITKDLDATKKEMSELNNVNDKLRADITAVNAEIMQLKAALEFKEAEKKFANECMQKAVREQQEMMYSIGNLQRIQLENEQLKTQSRYLLEQNTKLQASLEEYGLLRDHIQEYYKAFQDSQMEIQREKEKNRHINELLSKTGYRLDSMASELQNHRTTADSYRRSLEEKNETFHKLERELDRRTIDNEKLKEERDKCEQECFVYRDECRSLREYLEKSQAEFRELLSRTQKGASDGTTGLLRGQQQTRIYQTSTPIGKGFQNLGLHTSFSFDKMNRKK